MLVYTSKGLAWFGAVLSAMVGCKVKVLGLGAVRVPNKPNKGLVYLTTKSLVLGAVVGVVRVYLTTKGLVFGAVGGCGAGISYIQALAWCLAWC